jgi:hypothetical protein
MKRKEDQLWLDFDKAAEDLSAASGRFNKAAKALEKAGRAPWGIKEACLKAGGGEDFREEVKRLVGVLADQSGMDFHQVWVLLYHEFFKETGVHPVVEAQKKRRRQHLDWVAENGLLARLHQVVLGMLVKPEYAPRFR